MAVLLMELFDKPMGQDNGAKQVVVATIGLHDLFAKFIDGRELHLEMCPRV